jgi:hypothetical protein
MVCGGHEQSLRSDFRRASRSELGGILPAPGRAPCGRPFSGKTGMYLCYIGDFNCSFSDNYYFTGKGREVILDTLNKNGLRLVTAEQPECVDHIALTAGMTDGTEMLIEEWNQDKQLSDHKGILVKLSSS